MKIRLGYNLDYECPQPTPMILTLHVHASRVGDLLEPDVLTTDPTVPVTAYHDGFGNFCTRLLAPAGSIRISTRALIQDSGLPDPIMPDAAQIPVEYLPEDTLVFLLGSRYCETDLLSNIAWNLFQNTPPGWARVQAICDYVHHHIRFGYEHASSTKTAWDAYTQGRGVCRDYAHLAIAFCRAMNIPARYCTGYLPDIDVPYTDAPMDFAGWFEAFLGGSWHTFDARNNTPRIGRILMARGRDCSDAALSNTFGSNILTGFQVFCDEVT